MTREELKGKQTPGTAMMDDGPFVYLLNDINSNRTYAQVQPGWECVGFRTSKKECLANATLYAEAHNVANETGMWPLDMVERIKELEDALSMTLQYVRHGSTTYLGEEYAQEIAEQREANEYMRSGVARAILNKKS